MAPVSPAASSDARRSVTARTAPSSSSEHALGLGGVGQPQQAGRPAPRWRPGTRCPTGSAGQRVAGAVGGGEHDRDPGAGGDPGGVELGPHAAGADARRPGACRSRTPARSSVRATSAIRRLLRGAGRPSYRPSTSLSRTSRSACTRWATSAASRSLSPKRISRGGDRVVLVDDRQRRRARAAWRRSGGRCGSGCAGSCRRRSAAPGRRPGRGRASSSV